jgi:hypothetical protein
MITYVPAISLFKTQTVCPAFQLTSIRPSGHRAVDPSFLLLFGPESRCFFLALQFYVFASCQVPVASCFASECTANHTGSWSDP